MTVACRGRIAVEQALAGTVAILPLLLFTQPSRAEGDDHRTLQLLLKKGIITQQDYDQAVTEEQQAEQREQQENAVTKNGSQIKIGGCAELDFIGDTTRSFEEIIGNRPVLRSDMLADANGRYTTGPRNSRLIFAVRAPE